MEQNKQQTKHIRILNTSDEKVSISKLDLQINLYQIRIFLTKRSVIIENIKIITN